VSFVCFSKHPTEGSPDRSEGNHFLNLLIHLTVDYFDIFASAGKNDQI